MIRGVASVGLTLLGEGFGISLPRLLIGPVLGVVGFGTGKAGNGRVAELGTSQKKASQLPESSRSGRATVRRLESGSRTTDRKEAGNGAVGVLTEIATSAVVIESIVGLIGWLL